MKCKFCHQDMRIAEWFPDQVVDAGMAQYECACGAALTMEWFPPEDEEEAEECSACDAEVDPSNSELISTFCGSFCEVCYQEHVEECEICAGEENG